MTLDDQYPEHAKLEAISNESRAIGEFLDNGPYVLAEYRTIDGYAEEQLLPVSTPITTILAEHFGIDQTKLENEKRAMLAAMTELNRKG